MRILKILWYYWKTKRFSFNTRQELEEYQQQQFIKFKQQVLSKSPYFKSFIHLPFSQWPFMNKQIMMNNFDEINTAHLKKDELFQCALLSEQSKDFSLKIGIYSVGLSSGTSGSRGLFVVSPVEQQLWAGSVLAKMLPKGLFSKERIALFLRANNHLYQSINSHWLSLNFFGLFQNFQQQLASLIQYQPTIIVAPAQVLCAMAKEKLAGNLEISPYKVISVAEVLEPQDKLLLKKAFGCIGEIYQATEGFLATTCSHGTLHLNEEFIIIEPEWLDENRFVPIITDFSRQTQPIIRYRLDDILVRDNQPCQCGSPNMAISHIEGRKDDQIILKNFQGEDLTIFADYCSRIIAQTLPLESDYRLIQTSINHLQLIGCCETTYLTQCKNQLILHFIEQGADIKSLCWEIISVPNIPELFTTKRRRIIRQRIFS